METGSVADWVAAIATVVALAAAIYAARVAYRQLVVVIGQERTRAIADRSWAAARVAIWVRISDLDELPELRYINAGGMPIYHFNLWVATPDHVFTAFYVVDGPTSESKSMRRGTRELRRQIDSLPRAPDWTRLMEDGDVLCAATFRDSSNLWWSRDFHGRLEELTGQDAALIMPRGRPTA